MYLCLQQAFAVVKSHSVRIALREAPESFLDVVCQTSDDKIPCHSLTQIVKQDIANSADFLPRSNTTDSYQPRPSPTFPTYPPQQHALSKTFNLLNGPTLTSSQCSSIAVIGANLANSVVVSSGKHCPAVEKWQIAATLHNKPLRSP